MITQLLITSNDMMNNIRSFRLLFLAAVMLTACSKQSGFGPNYTAYNPPAVPVTVTNAIDYRPDPTVSTSLSGDSSITITLAIPAGVRTIKEITKVTSSSSYLSVQTSTAAAYNAAPIPGSGTTVTFTSSLDEYYAKNGLSFAKSPPKPNTELANHFYFEITLDDGTIVYTTPVRVLVLP
jgi:hypothetical protein